MTDRRGFIGIGAGAFLASLLPAGALAAVKKGDIKCNPRKVTVDCGLGKPFTVLHVSDSHLVLLNDLERRNPFRAELYEKRFNTWQSRYAVEGLAATVAYAKERKLPIIHTGDLIDFLGEANIEAAAKFAADSGAYCVAGNHEWAYYMFTKHDNLELMQETHIARLSAAYRNDLDASARVMGGVNFVSFNNWEYQVNERQDKLIRAEFEKGLPTVLLCHCPMYAPKLHESEVKRRTDKGNPPSTGLMGTPPDVFAEMLKANPREKWRTPTERTAAFMDWLRGRKNLKAVLCGHLHRYHEEAFVPGVMQYVVNTTSSGSGYEVTFT